MPRPGGAAKFFFRRVRGLPFSGQASSTRHMTITGVSRLATAWLSASGRADLPIVPDVEGAGGSTDFAPQNFRETKIPGMDVLLGRKEAAPKAAASPER